MNSACGQRALFALVTLGCRSLMMAQDNITCHHNDPGRTVTIPGGTHHVLYIVDKRDSIQTIDAGVGTVLYGATNPRGAL